MWVPMLCVSYELAQRRLPAQQTVREAGRQENLLSTGEPVVSRRAVVILTVPPPMLQ